MAHARRLVPWGPPGLLVALVAAFVLLGTTAHAAGPPPTPLPNGSPSPFPQSLITPPPALSPPPLHAKAVLVQDLDTGQILFDDDADTERPIASLTKIMTALITLETRRLSHVVTVTQEAATTPGSTLGLKAGEELTVRDLLYALLLQSSNDAAVALAVDGAKTTTAFVQKMNRRAAQLGLTATHFTSPNGLDDRGHSTARDLATLASVTLELPEFARVVNTKSHDIASPGEDTRHIQNRNILLWLYPGAFGVKTGFTSLAGECLVAAAGRDGRRLLSVVLGDVGESHFYDSAALLNYGFESFVPREVLTDGQSVGSVTVDGRAIRVAAAQSLTVLVRKDRLGEIRPVVAADANIALPVLAGQFVGTVRVLVHGRSVGEVPAVALATVLPPSPAPSQPPAIGGAIQVLAGFMRATFGPFL